MCLIENYNMILEKIGIVNTLPDKYSVSYVSQFGAGACFVVKSDCITNLLANLTFPFISYSICHTDCGHSSGLGYNHIDFLDRFYMSFNVLLNLALVFDYGLFNDF